MPDIWPQSVFRQSLRTPDEALRPFHCLLLTPFDSKRFEDLARSLESIVRDYTKALLHTVEIGGETLVERLDWVNSAGTIQHQIWERIAKADLIFCDLTGQNPNVMFEAGVCAAWKRVEQVIFLRDAFYRPDQPFDIAPFRYLTYELTSDGMPKFADKLRHFIADVVVRFPDRESIVDVPRIDLPLRIDFSDNRDDERLVTAPASHRRVRDGHLEFGSLWAFPHSWATIGKTRFSMFNLEFTARFAKLHPNKDHGYIGVGFRSHHPQMPFTHVLYLNRDGSVVVAHPDELAENGLRNDVLRGPKEIDPGADHEFKIHLSRSGLSVCVDDFEHAFAELPKLLTPGLIRFQAFLSWMGIKRVSLAPAE